MLTMPSASSQPQPGTTRAPRIATTTANTPSTIAYAPHRITSAKRLIDGFANASTPNAIAARPRITIAHHRVVTGNPSNFTYSEVMASPFLSAGGPAA